MIFLTTVTTFSPLNQSLSRSPTAHTSKRPQWNFYIIGCQDDSSQLSSLARTLHSIFSPIRTHHTLPPSDMSVAPANPAQAIAFAMRDYVNIRGAPSDTATNEFLTRIGGLSTLFALIVAIEDSMHLQLVKKVLTRVFDPETEAGRTRVLSQEVIASLSAGLSAQSPKHVRLACLQQAHTLIRFPAGATRLLQPDMLHPLIAMLRDDDVEITEEITSLVRKLGLTYEGMKTLFEPTILQLLSKLTIDDDQKQQDEEMKTGDINDSSVMDNFIQLIRNQNSSSSSSTRLNSIVLMRVLTLLTHAACGTPLPRSENATSVFTDAAHTAEAIKFEAWNLYLQRGVFRALLELAAIAEDAQKQDLLVQLNALELIEEVVLNCPTLTDAFASELTKELLQRGVKKLESNIATKDASASSSILPSSSFITVAVLRVFGRLASVASSRQLTQWYRDASFRLFLSACFTNYDDESVQTEAIDLIATLATFEDGLKYFSTVSSSLPSTVAPSKSSAYLSNPYADALTPILLYQIPYFVYGSSYSNGLRQLAAMHGMAKMFSTVYPDTDAATSNASASATAAVSSSSSASAASPSTSSPSSLLHNVYLHLQKYNSNKSSGLDVLLILAKQPFEDVREAVWKVVRGIVAHQWGIAAIASTAGFLEYLLDRRTEIHVSGTQAKFDIIRAISTSPAALNRLSEGGLKQVKEYVKQGAHYAPLQVHVKGPVSGAGS